MNKHKELHSLLYDIDEILSDLLKETETNSGEYWFLKNIAHEINDIEREFFDRYVDKITDMKNDS